MTEEERKEQDRQYAKKHYQLNKDKKKAYQEAKKEQIKLQKKEYFQKNKDAFYKRSKKYYSKNREKILQKSKLKNTYNKEKANNYRLIKRKNNSKFRLISDIRTIIGKAFRRGGYKKTSKTRDILGCDFVFFKSYIESKFEHWMTWENRGLYNGQSNFGWDIDH